MLTPAKSCVSSKTPELKMSKTKKEMAKNGENDNPVKNHKMAKNRKKTARTRKNPKITKCETNYSIKLEI